MRSFEKFKIRPIHAKCKTTDLMPFHLPEIVAIGSNSRKKKLSDFFVAIPCGVFDNFGPKSEILKNFSFSIDHTSVIFHPI